MPRITASDVQDIYDTDLGTGPIDAHIDAATELVDDIEAAGDVSSSRLAQIETYVAAHFVALQDPRVESETLGSGKWDYDTDTRYLDMAIRLDPTDTLSVEPESSVTPSVDALDGRGID